MSVLKIVLMIFISLVIGIGVSGYLTGVKNPSPLASLGKVFTSAKQSIGNALLTTVPEIPAPNAVPQEGYPTPGVTMTPTEISSAQLYFNQLAGVDMAEKKKEEEKAQKEKEKDAKENKDKIPSSLFPVPKKRRSLEDTETLEKGAVYALGTNPYGPPPNVKEEIFNLDSLLYIDNDPHALPEDYLSQDAPYEKQNERFHQEEPVQERVSPAPLDHGHDFTIQLGAFLKKEGAENLEKKLSKEGYHVHIDPIHNEHHVLYAVRFKESMTHGEAKHHKDILMKKGIQTVIVPFHKESL